KQVAPLADNVLENGPDRKVLARTDRDGMNGFSGLMLYVDLVYGSPAIMDMLEYLPRDRANKVRALDFVAALAAWLDSVESFRIMPDASRGIMAYLPAGTYKVRPVAAGRVTASETPAQAVRRSSGGWIRIPAHVGGGVMEYRRAAP